MVFKRVLIIDDEQDICLLLSGILKSLGYEPATAYTLKEARQRLAERIPDIAFVDLNLPDGTGFSIIPQIRELNPQARIIINSAYDGSKERNRAGLEGADYFIGKPLSKIKIIEALEAVK